MTRNTLCRLFLCPQLFICSSVPTVPLCPLFLCAYCSCVPTVPLCPPFLCAYYSSVPSVPLCLLFLCALWSSVPTVPLCLLFLCAYCSSVPTVPAYYSSVPTVPLSPLYYSVYEWLTISTLDIWMINDFNFRYMRNNPQRGTKELQLRLAWQYITSVPTRVYFLSHTNLTDPP